MKVIKRDGTIENYEQNKIVKVVKAAGLEAVQAQTLAEKVTAWVKNIKSSQLTSLEIRDKVIEELKKVNQYAANLFVWYEQTKEKIKDY